jgi:lysophospholipase L1-like esterase
MRCARGATYADYVAVLSDGQGAMREGLSFDHVHPTEAGYAAMRPVAEAGAAARVGRRALTGRRVRLRGGHIFNKVE